MKLSWYKQKPPLHEKWQQSNNGITREFALVTTSIIHGSISSPVMCVFFYAHHNHYRELPSLQVHFGLKNTLKDIYIKIDNVFSLISLIKLSFKSQNLMVSASG